MRRYKNPKDKNPTLRESAEALKNLTDYDNGNVKVNARDGQATMILHSQEILHWDGQTAVINSKAYKSRKTCRYLNAALARTTGAKIISIDKQWYLKETDEPRAKKITGETITSTKKAV